MSVMEDFLTPEHRKRVLAAAEKHGFAVDFYGRGKAPAEGLDQYEIIYGWCEPGDLKRATGLKWYCCGFAGVDLLSDDGLYANPDVMLSNSSGAYGLTISEHILMVTLMLLRRMPDFQDIVRRREWVQELPMRSIYGSRITVLGAGDTVVLLSDGITDADAVGLEALLCRFQSQDQQELADTVLAYAKAHTPADRRDDMSVIVARLLPN